MCWKKIPSKKNMNNYKIRITKTISTTTSKQSQNNSEIYLFITIYHTSNDWKHFFNYSSMVLSRIKTFGLKKLHAPHIYISYMKAGSYISIGDQMRLKILSRISYEIGFSISFAFNLKMRLEILSHMR